ncbi:MAG: 7-carboxy-7-deazaguanine synthase QueE [Deltaproteobacteria bacterium]|nr:7-carboxy-7-deazaguanine synthase QueE [Deltaproteobacteria bacterium]
MDRIIKGMRAPVCEIFYSIQGEGIFAGSPCIFVRFSGCNLRCEWCDTKYAWDVRKAHLMSVDDVYKKVSNFNCRRLVFTGGEPALYDEFMFQFMKCYRFLYFLETNGTIFPEKSISLFHHVAISPKLEYIKEDVIKKIIGGNCNVEFKFVVRGEEEIDRFMEWVKDLSLTGFPLIFQPLFEDNVDYIERTKKIADHILRIGADFDVRVLMQQQKIIWGGRRGV